jgi:hypothetical protein
MQSTALHLRYNSIFMLRCGAITHDSHSIDFMGQITISDARRDVSLCGCIALYQGHAFASITCDT